MIGKIELIEKLMSEDEKATALIESIKRMGVEKEKSVMRLQVRM